MKLMLDNADFELAVKEYIQNKFGVEVPEVDISGTKGKLTAMVSLDPDVEINVGPAKLTKLAKKPERTLELGGKAEKEVVEEELIEKEPDPVKEEKEEAPFSTGKDTELVEEEEPVVKKAGAFFNKKKVAPVVEEEELVEEKPENTTKNSLFKKKG